MLSGRRPGLLPGAGALMIVPIVGCGTEAADPAGWPAIPVTIEFRLAEEAPGPGLAPAEVLGEGETVYLAAQPVLTSAQITAAAAFLIAEGVLLEIWLSEEGRERMAATTRASLGRRMAVLVDDRVVTAAPIVATVDTDLALQVPVRIGPDEGERLVEAIERSW